MDSYGYVYVFFVVVLVLVIIHVHVHVVWDRFGVLGIMTFTKAKKELVIRYGRLVEAILK